MFPCQGNKDGGRRKKGEKLEGNAMMQVKMYQSAFSGALRGPVRHAI